MERIRPPDVYILLDSLSVTCGSIDGGRVGEGFIAAELSVVSLDSPTVCTLGTIGATDVCSLWQGLYT